MDFRGTNIRSPTGEAVGDGPNGKKASGLLMVESVLYMWARNADNSQLAWSTDRGQSWSWADWRFATSFGCPTFANSDRNYMGALDDFVYIYSPDSPSAYEPADRMVLARVPRDRIVDRSAYEFFETRDEQGRPVWTVNVDRRGAVFKHRGRCYRGGVTYSAALQRYLWCQILPGSNPGFERGKPDPRFAGGLGIYEAPNPWGPWRTVYLTDQWDVGPGESACFPSKWMSADGRTAYMVFSGNDCFSVRKATFALANRKGASR